MKASPLRQAWNRSALRQIQAYIFPHTDTIAGTLTTATTPAGRPFVLYLPPNREAAAPVPLLVHLHGAGVRWPWVARDVRSTAKHLEAAVAAGICPPMAIAAPFDPDGMSMWSDSRDGTRLRATEIIAELLPHVEATWSVGGAASRRFIQGFSMGGFGAAMLARLHPDLFAAAVVWDGAMHDWSTLKRNRSFIAKKQYGDDVAHFAKWSPWPQGGAPTVPVLVVAGALKDFAHRYTTAVDLAGGSVRLIDTPCGHNLFAMQEAVAAEAFAFLAQSPHRADL